MTKRANAKYKIDRRMGEMSDFGTQLRAKQKLKFYYGNLSERQFHSLYVEAIRMTGDSSENLIGLLERRLASVVYRSKWVSTVFAARQFVSHGHVKVNGKRVTIPSIRLKVGDVIELTDKAKEMVAVQEAQASAERDTPDYLEIAGGQVKMTRVPALSEVPYPVQMEPNLVVEFYSR